MPHHLTSKLPLPPLQRAATTSTVFDTTAPERDRCCKVSMAFLQIQRFLSKLMHRDLDIAADTDAYERAKALEKAKACIIEETKLHGQQNTRLQIQRKSPRLCKYRLITAPTSIGRPATDNPTLCSSFAQARALPIDIPNSRSQPLPCIYMSNSDDNEGERWPPLSRQISQPCSSSHIYCIQPPRGRPTALKVSTDILSLRRQFYLQDKINDTLGRLQTMFANANVKLALPHVPKCKTFYPHLSSSPNGDAGSHLPLPILSSLGRHPKDAAATAAYSMEYIFPFHDHHTKYLIRRHLGKKAQQYALESIRCKTAHFLGIVHLGANKPPSDSCNADTRDRPVYIDHLTAEMVNVHALAATMGAALAALHWACRLDARGVKFLLGRDRKGRIQMWMINFSHCARFVTTEAAVKTQLVDAMLKMPLVWPRPGHSTEQVSASQRHGQRRRDIWDFFRFTYLEVSHFILDSSVLQAQDLPEMFIEELEKRRGNDDSA